MTATQPNHATQSHKHPPGGNRGLTQAYQFRDASAQQALTLADAPANDLKSQVLRARALRDLNAVWDNACERIRILRGRPLPGSLKPKATPRKRKVQSGPLWSDGPAETPETPEQPATREPQVQQPQS